MAFDPSTHRVYLRGVEKTDDVYSITQDYYGYLVTFYQHSAKGVSRAYRYTKDSVRIEERPLETTPVVNSSPALDAMPENALRAQLT